MNWNILNFAGTDTTRVQYFRTVIASVSPDIFVCQEINGPAANKVLWRQVFQVFAPGVYDTAAFIDGPDSDNLIFFKKSKASFVSNTVIPTELRDINEFKMYIPFIQDTVRFYSVHLKASTGGANELQRGREVDTLRYHTNRLPTGKFFMVMGDFNIYSANEVAYTKLSAVTTGDGQFYDQINGMTGNWQNRAIYSPYYTQSPRVRSFGGGATGGLDDRFDLIMPSNACRDTLTGKFFWVRSQYTAYGNDGNHLNDSINKQPNTAVSVAVADGIHYASDHIPVISKFCMSDPPLPVNLASFTSSVFANNVQLKWSTAQEENNSGFYIERKSNVTDWQSISFVRGAGNSTANTSYSFTDNSLQSGAYQYRLKQVDYNGNHEYFNLSSEVVISVPVKFSLLQNYPNPFNPSTTINFELPKDAFVNLNIYDISGKNIMQLIGERKTAGYYSVQMNAFSLPSGTYFYKLKADGFSAIRKMVILK